MFARRESRAKLWRKCSACQKWLDVNETSVCAGCGAAMMRANAERRATLKRRARKQRAARAGSVVERRRGIEQHSEPLRRNSDNDADMVCCLRLLCSQFREIHRSCCVFFNLFCMVVVVAIIYGM
jgi:hypothetical protein